MLNSRIASYPHRHNYDGSFDSICRICFATIARSWDEALLEQHENRHYCEWWDLVSCGAQGPQISNPGLFLVSGPTLNVAVDSDEIPPDGS
jgi:hypothetical protein